MTIPPVARLSAALLSTLALAGGLLISAPAAALARSSSPDIVNGRGPTAGEFGFLASVDIIGRDGGVYVCGGAFVSPTLVVTAAHCLYDENGRVAYSAKVGPAADLRRPSTTVRVASWEIHERYSTRAEDHDIALLTLSRPIAGVQTVQIPTLAEWESLTRPGAPVRSAGWGITSVNGQSPRKFLVADLSMVSDSVCGDARKTVRIGALTFSGIGFAFDPATMVCAGGATASGLPIDTCQGDSGGPLVAGDGSAQRLVGIVSWGIGCAGRQENGPGPLTPGVYTRLASYLPWLAARGVSANPSVADAPTGVVATVSGDATISLTWTAPRRTGASDITSYLVQESVDGGAWENVGETETADTAVDIVDVASGYTYRFRVAAINDAGPGPFSSPSAAVSLVDNVVTVPGVVAGFSRSAFARTGRTYAVTVRWKAPVETGGADVTGYLARYGTGGTWSSWNELDSPAGRLSALRPGTRYVVQVQAVNEQGPGAVASYSFTTPR